MSVTARVNVIVEYLLEGEQSLANLPSILAKDLDMGLLQAPLLQELIVCHKASRTLFVADSGFFVRALSFSVGVCMCSIMSHTPPQKR